MRGHTDQVNVVKFSPDGKLLASAGYLGDSTIRLWDVEHRRELLPPLEGQHGFIESLAFSSDGMTLASPSGDGSVRLWSVSAHKQLLTLKPGYGYVAFSPNGNTLATDGMDERHKGRPKVWHAATFQETYKAASRQ